MKKVLQLKVLLLAALPLLASSCANTTNLYDWKGYDNAVYAYLKKSDENSEENLVKMYEKLINNSGGTRQVPPPGICADYGYMLIKKGEIKKGKALLVKETTLYPESKPFVELILKRFEK